jgi:hypothetical protein
MKTRHTNGLYSSSLRALRSSPPFPLAVLPLVLLLPPLPLAVTLLPPLRRRRRRRRRSPTRTWASVSSTKRFHSAEPSQNCDYLWGKRNLALLFRIGRKLPRVAGLLMPLRVMHE